MNERIKELAEQAGFYKYGDHFEEIIELFAELVRADEADGMRKTYMKMIHGAIADEREACAITAWSIGLDLYLTHHDIREVGSACATAIRARGYK